MRRALVSLLLLWSAAVADGTIMPLFETDSAAAYNRWLWEHRSEYAGIPPVRALRSSERTDTSAWLPAAVFLTDSGTAGNRRVYSESIFIDDRVVGLQVVRRGIRDDGDRAYVWRTGDHRSATTAYDRFGRELFESEHDLALASGQWFSNLGTQDSTYMLDDSGKTIGALPRVWVLNSGRRGDTLFAARTDSGILVFDRATRVIWRSRPYDTEPLSAAVHPHGGAVAVGLPDSVVVYDLRSGRSRATYLGPAPGYWVVTTVLWSDDGRHLAVYRFATGDPDSADLWVFTREGKRTLSRRLGTGRRQGCFWMGDTVVVVRGSYEPNPGSYSGKAGPEGSCCVVAVTLRGDVRTWVVPGRFTRLGNWYQVGRTLAYRDDERYYAVFTVPVK